jgi:hypothetical protein
LAAELAVLRVGLLNGSLVEELPEPVRTRLDERLALLRGSVRQATISQIEGEVAKLMLAFPSTRSVPVIDAQLQARKYAEDLQGVPLWAVQEACRDVSRGSVPGLNPDFPPSSPRLRLIVDGYVTAVHREARAIKEVLEAPLLLPENPEVRGLIREGLRARSGELARLGETPPKPAPTPEEIKAHYDAHGLLFTPKHEGDVA